MMPLSDVRDQVCQNIDSGFWDEIDSQVDKPFFDVWDVILAGVGRSVLNMTLEQTEEDMNASVEPTHDDI